jgi:signal transduction histidine kinase
VNFDYTLLSGTRHNGVASQNVSRREFPSSASHPTLHHFSQVPVFVCNRILVSGIRLSNELVTYNEKAWSNVTSTPDKPLPNSSGLRLERRKEKRFAEHSVEGKLVASLAHEINNPLDSLLNLLYLMESESTLTEKGHQYLMLAEEEVQRVSQIAHAALEGSRELTGPKDVSVPNLVGSVVDLYRSRFETRGISIDTRYCLDGHLPIYAGPLRQVLSNLLLNAADATPKGGAVHVRVSSAREWSGQQRRGLRVTFADNGSGIATENLHRICEPFFTTKGSGGSGLGLSVVRDVVQKHGGSLHVRSSTKPGRSGSIFAIFLPAA